jgi:hypothetical protein
MLRDCVCVCKWVCCYGLSQDSLLRKWSDDVGGSLDQI